MITHCLYNNSAPSILDLGSCVGRHSLYARRCRPEAKITVVESDTKLRQHCLDTFQPHAAYADFSDISIGLDFDVVFMLGLGLGIFGDEDRTRQGLLDVLARLKPGGSLLIEGGKSTPGDFTTQRFSIRYGQDQDEPFNWGYATFDWLQNTLENNGQVKLSRRCRTSNGDNYFICQINKLD
jgi:16S rRNA G1207 methylase RsmC